MKAAVDIGTNTLRMLMGTVNDGKVLVEGQFIEETRLGVGITKGLLIPDAVDRTLKALERFQKITKEYGVREVTVVATSAVRDAANGKEFAEKVFQKTGWKANILSGEEEAKFSYRGAVSTISCLPGLPVVIDIGGGSTEIIYEKDGEIKGTSVNVGAVRLSEMTLSQNRLREKLFTAVKDIALIKDDVFAVGVGGTATTAAAIYYGVKTYSRQAVHGKNLSLEDIRLLETKLGAMSLEERKKVAGLTPQRADIIIPGLQILLTVLGMLGVECLTVSDAGILDGLLLSF